MVLRRAIVAWVAAILIWAAVALGNSDQSSAMAPVTKGAAALVPPSVWDLPLVPRLVTFSPGALSPLLPRELPRFDSFSGLPSASQAATGITQEWRVTAEPPTVP
jgi:hypothetical protein